ncbi:MAG: tRNA lysidine(34) synthetase TilS [Methylobacter sp.]
MQDEKRKAKISPLTQDCILKFRLEETQHKLYVAYSGGVDSHVLLHLCAAVPQLKNRLIAVYIHHGLQPEAESWAGHCELAARELGVEFVMQRVNAHPVQGESPEEAARNARYAAFKSLIQPDDVVLLAQHREDQLETVLLQLFRGSGLRGLSGMPERIAFGVGVMVRPFLDVPKQAILDYALFHRLSWVEDPSNQSSDYDRNFLRNEVMPLLKQRWPAIDKTVARAAKHCADAQVLVDEVADELFASVFDAADNTLRISRLTEHHQHQQHLIIRHWFRHMGFKMPSQAFVERILGQVVAAAEQRDPSLLGLSYSIRRYRDKLYCLNDRSDMPRDCTWPAGQDSVQIGQGRILFWRMSSTGISREQWQNAKVEIKFRQGGEKICLPGRQGHHSLKNLFQEAGVPPWERDATPLIYLDGKLAAVGDRWISAAFYSQKTEDCVVFICNVKN